VQLLFDIETHDAGDECSTVGSAIADTDRLADSE
jgi:hypothetical protein